jgi:hypothetical protein
MGKLIIDSIFVLDRPVIVAYLMVIVMMFIVINSGGGHPLFSCSTRGCGWWTDVRA